jgi:hypothetical protein
VRIKKADVETASTPEPAPEPASKSDQG